MKNFLTKSVIFAVFIAIFAFSINFILEKGLKKTEFGEYKIWNDIIHSKINADLLINGSSRALLHIDPKILDSVLHVNSYNLGMEGYPFPMEYARFKLYEKYNKKPRAVVQIADVYTLAERTDAYHRGQFLPYADESLLRKDLKKIGFTDFELTLPALRYHSDYQTIYMGFAEFFGWKHFPSDRYKGYVAQNKREWGGKNLEKILARDSLTAATDPNVISMFDEFLHDCEKDNIKVILVNTPQYIKATEFTKNKKKIDSIYNYFAKKYDFPYLDYSQDTMCADTLYFYNAMHMNKKGAELFTKKLAADIKKLGYFE